VSGAAAAAGGGGDAMVGGFGRGRWGVGLVESEGCSWHGGVLGIVVACGIEKADWFFGLMVGEDGNVLVGKVVATVMQMRGFLSATFFSGREL
jgi:hypothetical protein